MLFPVGCNLAHSSMQCAAALPCSVECMILTLTVRLMLFLPVTIPDQCLTRRAGRSYYYLKSYAEGSGVIHLAAGIV